MKVKDAIIGHAIGDAFGVPLEFKTREEFINNPVTEMTEYGTHHVPKGSWSDDTSMEIATIASFIKKGKFDYDDIMQNFVKWFKNGDFSPLDYSYDVGTTCGFAIYNYMKGIPALECGLNDIYSNGNGSLMRILPVALYSYYQNINEEEIVTLTNNISSLTHSHNISKLGCYIYVRFIMYLLEGLSKKQAYINIQNLNYSKYYDEETISKYNRILKDNINEYKEETINSSGYVIDSLEASLWVILNTNNFKDSIIKSTNLGGDTDTIGAITGSMAGIIYGYNEIPKEWINSLLKKDYLLNLCTKFEMLITN